MCCTYLVYLLAIFFLHHTSFFLPQYYYFLFQLKGNNCAYCCFFLPLFTVSTLTFFITSLSCLFFPIFYDMHPPFHCLSFLFSFLLLSLSVDRANLLIWKLCIAKKLKHSRKLIFCVKNTHLCFFNPQEKKHLNAKNDSSNNLGPVLFLVKPEFTNLNTMRWKTVQRQ